MARASPPTLPDHDFEYTHEMLCPKKHRPVLAGEPRWVTDEMRRYADEVVYNLHRKEFGRGGYRTGSKAILRSMGLPETTEIEWGRRYGLEFSRWFRARIREGLRTRLPEVWGAVLRCALGEGDETEIRGIAHVQAFLKLFDPKWKERHEVEVVDWATAQARRRELRERSE